MRSNADRPDLAEPDERWTVRFSLFLSFLLYVKYTHSHFSQTSKRAPIVGRNPEANAEAESNKAARKFYREATTLAKNAMKLKVLLLLKLDLIPLQ